ncbi:MAG TPA: ABC transporter substrate-binding protein, partial [Thermomicrobiales bacterium]|nr:ABC transporter substrate-binding protein [Thermomicrobiales bacterium]
MANQGKLWSAWEELKAGRLSRRQFIERATALGVGMPVIIFCLNALGMSGSSVAAQSTPAGGQGRPSAGTDGQTRGAGDELKILLWQAPTHLSPHTGNGTKDYLAASFVSEGLMSYMPDATVIANLVKEVPSVENGLLAKDLSTVTYNLLEGIKWSDGEPFTSKDVLFTWQWITNPDNGSVSIESYKPIKSIETPDDLTVKFTFNSPTLAWYVPFTGTLGGNIYPGHLWDFDPTKQGVIDQYKVNPVGTGPYKVESFKPNDQIVYVVNDNYREPNKPYFAKVNVKGGGEASA